MRASVGPASATGNKAGIAARGRSPSSSRARRSCERAIIRISAARVNRERNGRRGLTKPVRSGRKRCCRRYSTISSIAAWE